MIGWLPKAFKQGSSRVNGCLFSKHLAARSISPQGSSALPAGKAGRRECRSKATLRVNILRHLEGELLGSDGLEDSREAEEESELGSVLIYLITANGAGSN